MVTITKATAADAEDIIALQKLAYQSEAKLYNDYSLPPLTQTLESLQGEFENSIILKAVLAGKIIGSVRGRVESTVCKVGRLIVHPEFQRQGIGSRLLLQLENHFTGVKFELFTGSKSLGNIRLYQRHGYCVSGNQSVSEGLSLIFLTKG